MSRPNHTGAHWEPRGDRTSPDGRTTLEFYSDLANEARADALEASHDDGFCKEDCPFCLAEEEGRELP